MRSYVSVCVGYSITPTLSFILKHMPILWLFRSSSRGDLIIICVYNCISRRVFVRSQHSLKSFFTRPIIWYIELTSYNRNCRWNPIRCNLKLRLFLFRIYPMHIPGQFFSFSALCPSSYIVIVPFSIQEFLSTLDIVWDMYRTHFLQIPSWVRR